MKILENTHKYFLRFSFCQNGNFLFINCFAPEKSRFCSETRRGSEGILDMSGELSQRCFRAKDSFSGVWFLVSPRLIGGDFSFDHYNTTDGKTLPQHEKKLGVHKMRAKLVFLIFDHSDTDARLIGALSLLFYCVYNGAGFLSNILICRRFSSRRGLLCSPRLNCNTYRNSVFICPFRRRMPFRSMRGHS